MNLKHGIGMSLITLLLVACAAAQAAPPKPLVYTGFIEAETLSIASPDGGRVLALPVEVGEAVTAGTVLVQLDDRLPRLQVAQAEATVAIAQAQLDMARAGATDEARRQAEAGVAQATAAREGACRIAELAQSLEEHPYELERQLAAAQAQARAADAAYRAALAQRDAAAAGLAYYEELQEAYGHGPVWYPMFTGEITQLEGLPPVVQEYLEQHPGPVEAHIGDYKIVRVGTQITVSQYMTITLPVELKITPALYEKAQAGVKSAAAARDGARSVLALLYDLRDNPTSIRTQVQQAALQCRIAQGNEAAARAAYDALQAGATAQELAALEAALKLAQAQLAQAQVALARRTLTAPQDGIVMERAIEVGELALPNATLLTLARLDPVYLTVYIPNAELGRVRIGQAVTVRAESLPDETFQGDIIFIGTEAVFPPANVPQPNERAALVFEVRVRVANPAQRLRPGMAAQVVIGGE